MGINRFCHCIANLIQVRGIQWSLFSPPHSVPHHSIPHSYLSVLSPQVPWQVAPARSWEAWRMWTVSWLAALHSSQSSLTSSTPSNENPEVVRPCPYLRPTPFRQNLNPYPQNSALRTPFPYPFLKIQCICVMSLPLSFFWFNVSKKRDSLTRILYSSERC